MTEADSSFLDAVTSPDYRRRPLAARCPTRDTYAVTASSNPNLSLPLALSEDGEVDLPLGTHTITWTAEDSSGNSSTLEQTVVIRPAVQSTHSVFVRNERSTITGAVANSGSGGVFLEPATITGDVASASVVEIGHRAVVGNVLSAIDIVWDDGVAVADYPDIESETIAPVGFAPALDLSSVSFPTVGGQIWVNSNQSLSLSPGEYGNYTVHSGATLTLSAGVYFFEQLALNHAARSSLPMTPFFSSRRSTDSREQSRPQAAVTSSRSYSLRSLGIAP